MINYETIISNFDDKVTLYNWLRKVEEALKNASATNFVVNKKGNATLSFSITFADGETLESGDIVLQQGESVDQARIAGGVLQLHLTNGTWLTAGNLGAVTNFSIDANQHLIVNYQDGTSQDLGAIFNGNVNINGNFTANSIIENMSGYSFLALQSMINWTAIFAGVVKNGNKITFVVFGSYTKQENDPSWCNLAYMYMPTSVGSRLYPFSVAGTNILDSRLVQFIDDSTFATYKNISAFTIKNNDGQLQYQLRLLDQLEVGKTYYFRIEQTFLLSNNLAQ